MTTIIDNNNLQIHEKFILLVQLHSSKAKMFALCGNYATVQKSRPLVLNPFTHYAAQ